MATASTTVLAMTISTSEAVEDIHTAVAVAGAGSINTNPAAATTRALLIKV